MESTDTANRFLSLIQTDTLPSLGPDSRSGVRSESDLIDEVDTLCSNENLLGRQQELLRSAALLWHDDLDGSHDISQSIKTSEGSFLHGIMHRREPDNSNAKYWFRLVGDHPCYPELADTVSDLLSNANATHLLDSLVAGGDWDAFAFVDACTRSPSPSDYPILQQVQELEFKTLVRHILS